jgi:hypothetical protein
VRTKLLCATTILALSAGCSSSKTQGPSDAAIDSTSHPDGASPSDSAADSLSTTDTSPADVSRTDGPAPADARSSADAVADAPGDAMPCTPANGCQDAVYSGGFLPSPTIPGDFYTAWGGITASTDLAVTAFDFDVTGVVMGTAYDLCVDLARTGAMPYKSPGIGGYSEIMCWHANRYAAANSWAVDLDLSQTPLYIPAGTQFVMDSALYTGNMTTSPSMVSFRIATRPYVPGEARYRMLRLPYSDQGLVSGDVATSYYISTPTSPLHVLGYNTFVSFGMTDGPAAMNVCLQWVEQGGAIVQEDCLPTQSVAPGSGYTSPPFEPVDWTLASTDLLTASCTSAQGGDCALYVVTEVPPSFAPGPPNAFNDYGNVPPSTLQSYCAAVSTPAGYVNFEYFCETATPCTASLVEANCLAMFPEASCVSTMTCSDGGP